MRTFRGLEIRPFSQVANLPRVRIDRVRVEVHRTLFDEVEYRIVGTMGAGGEGWTVCRPLETLDEVWSEKTKIEAAIAAARKDEPYGREDGMDTPERAV